MAKIGKLQVDPKAELEGVWVHYVLDVSLKIARMGNREYDAAVRRMNKPYAKGFRAGNMPDEVLQDITMRAVAETVIKGWKNLEDDKGKPIKFSSKKALELFKKPENRKFYKDVVSLANDEESFQRESLEDAKGN